MSELFAPFADGDRVLVGKFDEHAEVIGDLWPAGADWMVPLHVGPPDGGYTITLVSRLLRPAQTEREGKA